MEPDNHDIVLKRNHLFKIELNILLLFLFLQIIKITLES
jgi:hypothetical protein